MNGIFGNVLEYCSQIHSTKVYKSYTFVGYIYFVLEEQLIITIKIFVIKMCSDLIFVKKCKTYYSEKLNKKSIFFFKLNNNICPPLILYNRKISS